MSQGTTLTDMLDGAPSVEALQQFADYTARMFYFMAKKMCDKLGEEAGLEAAREAIAELGRYRGQLVREKVLAAGLPLTMENEYKFHDLPIGSSIWTAYSRHEDGKKVSEITVCPFGQMWKKMGADKIGLCYCEIDYAIWEGYNPDIKYGRSHCIFEGDETCIMSYEEPEVK